MKYSSLETTANGMITTLSYLAIHQDEQEKAYMDVKNRLGPNGELVCQLFLDSVHDLTSSRIFLIQMRCRMYRPVSRSPFAYSVRFERLLVSLLLKKKRSQTVLFSFPVLWLKTCQSRLNDPHRVWLYFRRVVLSSSI